jgi:hypothetical protein
MVVKYSSRVNEDMGRVIVWKLLDMTHEMLLGKTRKVKKIVGIGQKIHTNGLRDHSRKSRAHEAL